MKLKPVTKSHCFSHYNKTLYETSSTMKTHQLTKKDNHRPNWPNFFLMLGTGILTLIVLFKERGW